LITAQWEEVLRLAGSIRYGTVTASLIIRKLASYPRQNSLHAALREVGRIERTFFILEWMQDPELQKRVQGGSTRAKPETRWPGQSSLTAKANSATEPWKTNVTVRAVST
jgi:TnpA family transposase